jgi:hydrogenase 3 maturation protease
VARSLGAERLESLRGAAVVMGIGNRWRGDDAAGPLVVEALAGRTPARCIDAGEAPERHLGEALAGSPASIVLVDAVDFGGHPGELAVFAPEEMKGRLAMPHRVPMGTMMSYMRAMSGANLLLLGIQPAQTEFGEPVSEPVRRAVGTAVELLASRLDSEGEAETAVGGPTSTRGRERTDPCCKCSC